MLKRLNESVDTMHLFLKIRPNEEVVLHNLKSMEAEILGETNSQKNSGITIFDNRCLASDSHGIVDKLQGKVYSLPTCIA